MCVWMPGNTVAPGTWNMNLIIDAWSQHGRNYEYAGDPFCHETILESTYWDRVNYAITASDNGLSPLRRQAII